MGLSEAIVGLPQTKETRFRKVIIWPTFLTWGTYTLSINVCHLPPLTLFSKSVDNIRSVQTTC